MSAPKTVLIEFYTLSFFGLLPSISTLDRNYLIAKEPHKI